MGQILIGYHGCDITTRDGFVSGKKNPKISRNPYDWLYDGLCFFEGDCDRALKLATAASQRSKQTLTRQPIATPAVVGVVLDIDRIFDLSTQNGIENFASAAALIESAYRIRGKEPPKNMPAFEGDTENLHRAFDREVCKFVHDIRKVAHLQAIGHAAEFIANGEDATEFSAQIVQTAPYQASRGAYEQGKLVDPSSAIYDDTHLQIAVHDLSCIKGWFLRPGDKLLSSDALLKAEEQLTKAKAQRSADKPRKRAG